ncbi:gamma-glutamyltransferase [Xanthomonas phaseoli pv. phaseoli]|uniref:Glutathione hydrolase proenzyme n=1 Tax=Xanthomonas campestris pv. phaseoli TaxID=317013 RepID=A0AB34QMS9_XANCH|nr:gamma-glutamyltransferase [Xanthomonas phaseoli]KHS40862.1 gamma-glutamyltransferase [Xanthomonas phaseoli pv. phaseoli]MDM4800979.1 gamma-glutamyltransferase [Xanthomonas phaseoli pv. phaseoli]MDM4804749.1 gamma-glutamyltransferase [Xanthomonas phaseoli pv. phaseoli]MDM4808814.1 gamma-glutamyltransferase [Xanthomonas phaseoli pv. phaseoli]QWN25875.1 gamma-glutamyltransferase [Xanthomonas phaseoli pv. phaseoli]
MRRVPVLLVSALALLASPLGAADRVTGLPFATRSEVIAPHAMAATSQPLATQIALDVMKDGGSAVDAAIAANAALGLMEPTGNGVGGDLFAIVWDPKTSKLYGYNGSGRSPKSLTLAEFQRRGLKDIPPTGPLPVSVPGAVDGWFALHARFGRKPMAQNLAPAIRYAREGHPVAETIAYYWDRSVPRLSQYTGFKEQFTIDGHAPRKGELWKNPNLANTLQQIADGGRDAFYKGEIARTIGAYFKANGGYLSYDDMASHQGEWVEPVSTNYRGVDVWELPPNSQGIAALQMLNILEGYDFSKIPFGSAEHVHLFTEAKKLAFADRARFYADPAFQPAPLARLISKDYAGQRRALISMGKALKEVQPGTPKQLEEGDTIYMTVADADGMMVSLIQSNYRGMGSGMAPPGLGFILQDRGEMFVLKKDHPNGYAPGKRPFQTIIPAFVTKDGKPWLSFGVMGGAMQPQGHVQIVMNLVDFHMNLQEAGDAPRIQHEGSTEPTGQATAMSDGGEVNLETGFSYDTIRALMRKGHRVIFADGPYGGYQAIARDPASGVYYGASESRKDGQAAGY